jgi:hypothetical protein
MAKEKWQEYIDKVSQENDTDIYLISGPIENFLDRNVLRVVQQNKLKPNALVLLSTFGGDADVAYRIARCFQGFYTKGNFVVYVPDICKSAGTLVVLGADEIIMSNSAQLGPLDVQLGKPDEIGKSISGLIPVQSLEFLKQRTFELFEHYFLELIKRSGSQITTKTSAEIATKLITGMFQPVYSQLDPMRLGEYQRNMKIAEEYGKRLNAGNLKADALHRLTDEYPSHSFVIDIKEAKELFNKIRYPSEAEENMTLELEQIIISGLVENKSEVYYLAPSEVLDERKKKNEKKTNKLVEPNGDKSTDTKNQK